MLILLFFISHLMAEKATAFDCSDVESFEPVGTVYIEVEAAPLEK